MFLSSEAFAAAALLPAFLGLRAGIQGQASQTAWDPQSGAMRDQVKHRARLRTTFAMVFSGTGLSR